MPEQRDFPAKEADAAKTSGEPDVIRLAIAQALAGANASVVYATGAIVGNVLAPDHTLATLPISVFVVGMAACTLPAGTIAQNHGRRAAFLVGTAAGVIAGLIAAVAVVLGSFVLYCAATFFGGAYAAVVLSFRFAAADCVPADRRARALSMVMAGGVFAGVLGPQLVTRTMDLWPPYLFAATYLAQAAVAGISALVLLGVAIPKPGPRELEGGRPLTTIVRQPRFITAVVCGVVSYLVMNFLMTAAPLAMRICGLSQEDANTGLQWHIIAMYAPGFFTGRLISRFGSSRVVAVGLVLLSSAAIVGLMGVDVPHFWLMLILLGVGWNFGFVGASSMVLDCHRPEERTRVQSFNDFLVFGTMTVGSLASGSLLTTSGWQNVLEISFFPIGAAIVALVAMKLAKRNASAVEARR